MGYDDVDCKDAESFFHQDDAPALHHLVLKKSLGFKRLYQTEIAQIQVNS